MPKWTPETDAKLLAAIAKTSDAKFDMPAIAALMSVPGDECTVKALTHRMAKLKQVAKETWPDDDATAATAPPKTPKKRKGTSAKDSGDDAAAAEDDDNATAKGSTGKKRKVATAKKEREGSAEGSEEAAAEATPVKKGRGRGRPKKAEAKLDTAVGGNDEQKVKTEDADEEVKAEEEVKVEENGAQGESSEAEGKEAAVVDENA